MLIIWRRNLNRLTIFVHSRVKTFFQSASPALIPMRLVNRASPFEVTLSFASIHTSPMNASFEEARAAWKGFLGGNFYCLCVKYWYVHNGVKSKIICHFLRNFDEFLNGFWFYSILAGWSTWQWVFLNFSLNFWSFDTPDTPGCASAVI